MKSITGHARDHAAQRCSSRCRGELKSSPTACAAGSSSCVVRCASTRYAVGRADQDGSCAALGLARHRWAGVDRAMQKSLMPALASRCASPTRSPIASKPLRFTSPLMPPVSAAGTSHSAGTSIAGARSVARRMARSCQGGWSTWCRCAGASCGTNHRPPAASGALTRPPTRVLWPGRATVGGGGHPCSLEKWLEILSVFCARKRVDVRRCVFDLLLTKSSKS